MCKFSNSNYIKVYLNGVKEKLELLEYPYGFTLVRYIIIKYLLSFFVFVCLLLRSQNITLSFVFLVLLFFLPNYLIYSYSKSENLKLISQISNIVQSLIISLSASVPLKEALKISINVIKYDRFKKAYEKFINDYIMYNLNMRMAIENFSKKFNSYEFNMFISILSDLDKEGNMIEGLEIFSGTLENLYFKYLRYKASKNFLLVSFSTVISLINIFAIVAYPMFIQISDGLKNIFI